MRLCRRSLALSVVAVALVLLGTHPAAATVLEHVATVRASEGGLQSVENSHGIATDPDQQHLYVINTLASLISWVEDVNSASPLFRGFLVASGDASEPTDVVFSSINSTVAFVPTRAGLAVAYFARNPVHGDLVFTGQGLNMTAHVPDYPASANLCFTDDGMHAYLMGDYAYNATVIHLGFNESSLSLDFLGEYRLSYPSSFDGKAVTRACMHSRTNSNAGILHCTVVLDLVQQAGDVTAVLAVETFAVAADGTLSSLDVVYQLTEHGFFGFPLAADVSIAVNINGDTLMINGVGLAGVAQFDRDPSTGLLSAGVTTLGSTVPGGVVASPTFPAAFYFSNLCCTDNTGLWVLSPSSGVSPLTQGIRVDDDVLATRLVMTATNYLWGVETTRGYLVRVDVSSPISPVRDVHATDGDLSPDGRGVSQGLDAVHTGVYSTRSQTAFFGNWAPSNEISQQLVDPDGNLIFRHRYGSPNKGGFTDVSSYLQLSSTAAYGDLLIECRNVVSSAVHVKMLTHAYHDANATLVNTVEYGQFARNPDVSSDGLRVLAVDRFLSMSSEVAGCPAVPRNASHPVYDYAAGDGQLIGPLATYLDIGSEAAWSAFTRCYRCDGENIAADVVDGEAQCPGSHPYPVTRVYLDQPSATSWALTNAKACLIAGAWTVCSVHDDSDNAIAVSGASADHERIVSFPLGAGDAAARLSVVNDTRVPTRYCAWLATRDGRFIYGVYAGALTTLAVDQSSGEVSFVSSTSVSMHHLCRLQELSLSADETMVLIATSSSGPFFYVDEGIGRLHVLTRDVTTGVPTLVQTIYDLDDSVAGMRFADSVVVTDRKDGLLFVTNSFDGTVNSFRLANPPADESDPDLTLLILLATSIGALIFTGIVVSYLAFGAAARSGCGRGKASKRDGIISGDAVSDKVFE